MMSNQTILLEQEISSDIAERRDLMSRIKLLSPRYNFSEVDEHLFLNYSIPIIYSVWEGFIQSALQIYIRSLNRLSLSPDDICDRILVYHMEAEFLQFKQYPRSMNREDQLKRTKQKVRFFEELKRFYSSEILEINANVNTESNVSFSVLNRILGDFNLAEISEFPLPRYSLKVELDQFLLRIRNAVAHGQNSVIVKLEDLERAITLVERLMDLVFKSIRDGFINESYRKR